MANKFPLILNTSANQIQEIASGDNLDLTGCKIVGLQGINSAGIVTFTKAHVGAATTWGEDLVVTGNARVTGILTVGTNSVVINGNDVNITGVTTASNFKTGTSNLHSAGVEVAGVNVLGADTPIGLGATIYNSGAAVFTGVVTATNYVGTINTPAQPNITSVGTLSALNVSGNVSIGGTLTYEDVTNIDAVGLITARNGINVSGGTATFAAAIDANSDLDVDGHTNLDNVSIAGVTTVADNSKLAFGTGEDLSLYHLTADNDGYIKYQNENGHLKIGSGVGGAGGIQLWDRTFAKEYLTCDSDGDVKIFFNDSQKFQTTNTGAVITGICTATELRASSAGNANLVLDSGTGGAGGNQVSYIDYKINGTVKANIACNEGVSGTPLEINSAGGTGSVELFHAGNKKFWTKSDGAEVEGTFDADRVDCNGLLHVQYGNATNTNYMSSLSNSNGIMHLFRGDGLYIGNNMNTSNQSGGPNNKAITLGTDGTIKTTGAIFVTTSGADANGVVIQNSAGLKMQVDTAKTVNMDARANGAGACILHKWNSPNLAGGSYEPYEEAWYDGNSYHHIKSANNQFEFDSPLKSIGNSANFTTEESGGASVEIRSGGAEGYIGTRTNHPIRFVTYSSSAGNGGRRWEINANGDFIPIVNDTYEIGSSTSRVKTAYIQDINIKNEVYAGTNGGDTTLWNNSTAGDRGWNWQDGASLGTFSICNNSQYSVMYLNKVVAGGVSDARWIDFRWDGAQVGTLKYSSNDVIINQESDYRLKENVVGITDGIAKVKQLNPVKFNFKSDAKGKDPSILNEGFLAHELQSVIPQAASGVKDATKVNEEGQTVPDYQGIWMPKMIPILTAALKEAITKIETLEAKVAALESS